MEIGSLPASKERTSVHVTPSSALYKYDLKAKQQHITSKKKKKKFTSSSKLKSLSISTTFPFPPPDMASMTMESQRQNAEVYHGAEICKQKSREMLGEINLPNGLLPLSDIVEFGINRSTGFVWVKQKKSTQHRFEKIGKTVSYGTEVTAFVEDRQLKRLTGVKAKEMLIWVSVNRIFIDDPSSGNITFGVPAGISRTFPVSTFVADDGN
ncbi:hypothetical protein Dimus_014508 [Dionaea muscipula]